jgi:prepilin-type N-terminal cleavage/methylation domain-containing protein
VSRRPRAAAPGFSLLEVAVVAALAGVVLALAFTGWRGYTAQQRLRYGTAQVATDLRQAQERAKAERVVYTVTFVASSPVYTIARSGGGFLENATMPDGVTAAASVTVTFSAFGRPDAAHTITVQSAVGTGVVTVTALGGISYQ